MVSVLLIWIYIFIVCYTSGCIVLKFTGAKDGYKVESQIAILLAGFSAITVYSEIFSIFYKVSLLANIVLVMILLLLGVIIRDYISENVNALVKSIYGIKGIALLLLIILMAYGTSKGYMHYDTDLYHAQSIRWIEEYGIVKGLGNLQSRLAYNSAAFCVSALFSFAFLGLQSFHTCAGFLALITTVLCVKNINKEFFKEAKISSFVRIAALFYLLTIYDEMVSPASDYFVVLLLLGIAIFYSDLCEKKITDPYPYALISLLGLVVFSMKISGAFILLLVIYPAWLLITKKVIKDIIKYVITGLITVAPFFIRNIILSGYLIYPVPAIDIFNFEHKMSKVLAEYDANEIEVFGRGHSDLSRINEPLKNWIFDWFRALDTINKLAFLATLVGILVFIAYLLWIISKRKWDKIPMQILTITICICFIAWIFTSPNIRFGCIFIYLAPMLIFGSIYTDFIKGIDRNISFCVFVCIFIVYKGIAFGSENINRFSPEYLILQQDYGEYEAVPYTLHGVTFYYPAQGDRMGYKYFPSSPMKAEDIFIGDDIKDGFRDMIHQK